MMSVAAATGRASAVASARVRLTSQWGCPYAMLCLDCFPLLTSTGGGQWNQARQGEPWRIGRGMNEMITSNGTSGGQNPISRNEPEEGALRQTGSARALCPPLSGRRGYTGASGTTALRNHQAARLHGRFEYDRFASSPIRGGRRAILAPTSPKAPICADANAAVD